MTLTRILICAGSDSGGGAGIQADIKTVTALGGYAMTAITALTAQNTTGVYGVMAVAPDFIRLQMRLVLSDLGADAIKTGMLGDAEAIAAAETRLNGTGRLLIRKSGTEPVIRVMAEGEDERLVESLVEELAATIAAAAA